MAMPKPVIASTKPDENPGCSPDGKRLAFSSGRSGSEELWLSSVDGSNPQQLTSLRGTIDYIYGPQWSPDGQSIAVNVGGGLGIVNSNSGALQRISVPKPAGPGKWPCWSRDGQWLYFSANGSSTGIWRTRPQGGAAVQITKGADDDMPQASFDGKFIYFNRGWPRELTVWRIPVEGGEETKIIDGVSIGGQWTVGPNGIYYFATPDEKGRSEIRLYEFATRKTKKILTVEHSVLIRIAVSPDGRSLFYPQTDDQGSDLMLVENFH
jgi:Tol biopolymer transport system component